MKCILFPVLLAMSLPACALSPPPEPASTGVKAGAENASSRSSTVEPSFNATAEDHAREALRKLNPRTKIDQIGAAPLAGFREAIVSGRVVYISDDGKYVLEGTLYDVQGKKDLGDAPVLEQYRTGLSWTPCSCYRVKVFAGAGPLTPAEAFARAEGTGRFDDVLAASSTRPSPRCRSSDTATTTPFGWGSRRS